jgi:hypothetical protein
MQQNPEGGSMSKQIWTVTGSVAVLTVVLLAVASRSNLATVNGQQVVTDAPKANVAAGSPKANEGSGAVPCNTTKSATASELCGTSTDPARWWNGAGITGGEGDRGSLNAQWHTQSTFFPPDAAYTHYALPKGDEKYAVLSGVRIKGYINDITSISRKSRDDGNQYWGRITGSEYDHMTTDYVAAKLKAVGVQNVHLQKFSLSPQWWPTHWDVSVTGGGKTIKLESAWPHAAQPCTNKDCTINNKGTEGKTWDLEPVWVGLGTPADFKGRDVNGKAVLIYSVPTPGGKDYTAAWIGAMQRARDGGAAVVFTILGFPGNHVNHTDGPASDRVTFALGMDDATVIREMIEKDESPIVHVNLTNENRTGLYTNSVVGTLPGMTDENILIMAHTEAPMQGAMDNASGIGTMIELAQYYASLPKSQRKRTITFLTTSAHHTPAPNAGIQWVRKTWGPYFEKTALIVNCEHTAGLVLADVGSDLAGSNAIAPRRYYVQGSDDLKALVTKTLVDYGVATYSRPAAGSGGELGELRGLAPGFHVLDDIGYHTDLDIPQYVPEAGLESVVRAYAKIIDEVNKMPLEPLRVNMGKPLPDRWTAAIENEDPASIPAPN